MHRRDGGYPSALRAKTWGFYDVAFGGKPFDVRAPVRQLRHGEHPVQDLLPGRVPRPDRGRVRDAAASAGQGPPRPDRAHRDRRPRKPASGSSTRPARWHNSADRDHCLQYMVAVPLIFGRLTADDYEDAVAADPRIDALREKMEVSENPRFTAATTSTRTSAPSATRCRCSSRTARSTDKVDDRVPDRPSPAPRRGHPGADGQMRRLHCAPTCRPPGGTDHGAGSRSGEVWRRCRSISSLTCIACKIGGCHAFRACLHPSTVMVALTRPSHGRH